MVGLEMLCLLQSKGGKSFLNITVRNEAIKLMKVKCYLDLGKPANVG